MSGDGLSDEHRVGLEVDAPPPQDPSIYDNKWKQAYDPKVFNTADRVYYKQQKRPTDAETSESKAWQRAELGIKERLWEPYSQANRELFLSGLFMPAVYYKIRWKIAQFFHYRLFTFSGYFATIGEIIFVPLIIGLTALLAGVSCCDYRPTGGIANIPFLLAFIFASKNSLITFLTGMPYERLLGYHKFFVFIGVVLMIMHGAFGQNMQDDEKEVTGIILSCLIGGIVVLSFYLFRRHFYEAFLRLHYLLAVAIIVLSLIHGAGAVALGGVFWVVDIAIRLLVVGINWRNTKKCHVVRLPGDVVRISFIKGPNFKYRAGQHLVLCIPSVSYFEWHPFRLSISSAPHEERVTIHLRVLGDWTKKLHDSLTKLDSESKQEFGQYLTVFIDGPFGSPSIDLDRHYKLYMFVSGGIGITPMQSIANELIHDSENGRKIDRIFFIWSCRDTHMVSSVLDFDKEYYEKQLPKDLPISFQPDLLDSVRYDGNVLESFYHLTKIRSESEFDKGHIDPRMQGMVRVGRPHLSIYFEKMFELAQRYGESHVAVMTCGPAQMAQETLLMCSSWSKDGITFHFHEETFEY